MRTYFTLVLVIIISIISLWLQEDSKKKPDEESLDSIRFPDYFMENFSITNMNEQGLPVYIIKARKMLHFADNDDAELEQPVITFTQADNKYTLVASRALIVKSENLIHLYDNVKIHRSASDNQNELSIYTDYLKIDTQTRIAETEQAARIKTKDAELHTTGLIFDNMQGIIKLKSQVKGIYETAR